MCIPVFNPHVTTFQQLKTVPKIYVVYKFTHESIQLLGMNSTDLSEIKY